MQLVDWRSIKQLDASGWDERISWSSIACFCELKPTTVGGDLKTYLCVSMLYIVVEYTFGPFSVRIEREGVVRRWNSQAMAAAAIIAAVFLFFFSSAAVAVAAPPFNVPTVSFSEGFSHLFGNDNLIRGADGRSVRLTLNRYSGSGFISTDLYDHGFFSASIKLPKDYTAGVVVAFYTSNADMFPNTHDEVDFEFLGNVKGQDWRIQTNIYGNGSTTRGREERYLVPFDPTEAAHRYSILWTPDSIIFYIDDVPIREAVRTEAMGGDFPSKPMSVYATIWDGSSWATAYGRIKINYKYEPYVSEFTDLVLRGCRVDPIQQAVEAVDRCAESVEELMSADFALLTPRKRAAMRRFRERYMIYSFCYDQHRYVNVAFPDCDYVSPEHTRFGEWGDNKVPPKEIRSRSVSRRRSRRPSSVVPAGDEMLH